MVVSAGMLLISLDNSVLYTALPTLSSELNATSTQQLWIVNAYPLMLAGLLLGSGTLSDRIGHRKMFLIGLWIFGAASALAAFAPNTSVLILARAVLGVGAATMMPATLALIRHIFLEEQERNVAMGIWGSVAVVGAASGPVVGGLLLEYFWWGSVFLINVPIVCLSIIFTHRFAPKVTANPLKHWDFIASALSLMALSGLTLAIKEATNVDLNPILLIAAIITSLSGAILFKWRQNALTEPLIDWRLFRNKVFLGGVIAAWGSMFLMVGMELMTAQKLQLINGFSPLQAGLVTAVTALAALPVSIWAGAKLQKIGFKPFISGGFLVGSVGAGIAAWASLQGEIWLFVLAMMLIGLGGGAIWGVTSTAIVTSAPLKQAGMAAGIEEVSFEFGTLVSVALLGSLVPALYIRFLPDTFTADPIESLYELIDPQVASAYTQGYSLTVLAVGVSGIIFASLTAWLLKANPKTGGTIGAH